MQLEFQTDKYEHGLIPFYDVLLCQQIDKTLLEIGVYLGGSLQYFATKVKNVTGIDISYPTLPLPSNVEFKQGNQMDSNFLLSLGEFDFIVDDGAHTEETIRNCLDNLWDKTRVAYIIEDWGVGYFPGKPYGNVDGLVGEIITNNKYQATRIQLDWSVQRSICILWKRSNI